MGHLDDGHETGKKLASTLKSAYSSNSKDPREPQRVKSLQLLCFKIANHKEKILEMLSKHETAGHIPFPKTLDVLNDFSKLTSLIFLQYDSYIKGEVSKTSDPVALKKLEDYIHSIILI